MTCRCEIEIGDYSLCPRHGDGSDWAKNQALQDALRAKEGR